MKNISYLVLVNTTYDNGITGTIDFDEDGNNDEINDILVENVDLAYVPWERNSMYCAFRNCRELVSVSNINENVKNMDFAFSNCIALPTPPEIPSSVISMSNTFSNCFALETAPEIPDNVENISHTFFNCQSLVTAPDLSSCTRLTRMNDTFNHCEKLENPPALPNTITSMWETFGFCTNLETAPVLPDSVTSLHGTFGWCFKLKNVSKIPNNIISMESTFYDCSALKNIPEIPSTITYLTNTFYGCVSIENAPDLTNCTNITNMYNTFSYCYNLTGDIHIGSNQIINAQSCFNRSTLTKNVFIPFGFDNGVDSSTYNSFISAGYNPFDRVQGTVLMDERLRDWRYHFLENRTRVFDEYLGEDSSIVVPNYIINYDGNVYVSEINKYTSGSTTSEANTPFAFNSDIIEVDLNNLNYVDNDMNYAFQESTSLENVSGITDSTLYMDSTFIGCTSLLNIDKIPSSVVTLSNTFNGCSLIESVDPITSTELVNMDSTFRNCTSLEGDIFITSEKIQSAMNCFDGTYLNKDVYILFYYENGANTPTYDAFIRAGYKTDVRVNGVLLKNSEWDIDFSDYIITTSDRDVELEQYIGSKEYIDTPHLPEE